MNFVLFDLSTLDSPSAVSYLTELARRTATRSLVLGEVCHWIVSPVKSLDLLSAVGQGADFFRRRLDQGDRLLCSHPTGLDWQGLFPMEAEQEIRTLTALISRETHLFLQDSGTLPPWITKLVKPVFRPGPQGLSIHLGADVRVVPWGRNRRGVWWIVPGQALVAPLPPLPWGDLVPGKEPRFGWGSRQRFVPVPVEPGPQAKLALSRTAELRRSTSTSPLHQAILFRTQDYPGLGTKEAVDFEEALGGIRKRALVANMQGFTDFQEGGLKVRFQNGKLIGIEDSLRREKICRGSESALVWNGRKHPFVTNSAFSFEGDFSWGLRQSLVLDHEDLAVPGRLIIDFFFVEESREFLVAASVRWRRWKQPVTIEKWSVLELELLGPPRSEALVTRSIWPDGRSHDLLHGRRPRRGELCGTDFTLSHGKTTLIVGFPQNQAPRPHYLPWRLSRNWGRNRLFINPEGGYRPRPSTEFEGIEEHFTFYLTRAEGAKLPFSVTRKQATELIPPYVMETVSLPKS